ncbi:MAG: type II toxin-antitoxin system HicA family toxin [Rhodoferax sp.]|nr:type II toxin-antitoxin system HicA family toxin [Rhodoferax sp.]
MSQLEKLLLRLLRGTSDTNIGFDELCGLLTHLGFTVRVRGSHHVFSKPDVVEQINLQRDGSNAKPYQVKQVRNIIVKYKLEI